ncbi:MAG: hypothetical protein ACK2TS_01105 [Anaerolineales bacterium]
MGYKNLRSFAIMAIAVILLSSCGIPNKTTDVPTESAADIVLQTAQGAAAATLTQQAMLIPTSTNTPTPTMTLEPTTFSTAAPTLSNVPMLSVSKDTNCRTGQGVEFEKVGGLFAGNMTEIIGIDSTGGYFYIRNPDNPQGFCWIVGTFVTIVGDISYVPRFTPMPKPTIVSSGTPEPTFAISSAVMKVCNSSYWFDVEVLNNGNLVWTSGSVAVYDAGPPITTIAANAVNDFTTLAGCPAAPTSVQGDLANGESGHLQSTPSSDNPTGHEISLTIKLCNAEDLGGTCVTNTYIFTP